MGIVLLLMTICGLTFATVLLTISHFTKNKWLRTFVFGGVFTWLTGYVILLFVGSFFSVERTLALNEPKEFCGFYFDCHMHASVTGVRKAKTIGGKTASGEFYIARVKVFSDARSATLGLNTVEAIVLDAQKRVYARDEQAEAFLDDQPPFDKQISPTENFEKEIVFDLPTDAQSPRLDIKEGYGIDHFIEGILIGDEDSIGHKRNYFKLDAVSGQIASN